MSRARNRILDPHRRADDAGALAAAIRADGKIVAAGDSLLSHDKFALARYNTDGKLDGSFGGDGKVTTRFGTDSDAGATGVAIQSDGKIVAAGFTGFSPEGPDEFALARYNTDGTLDSAFGGDGKVTAPVGGSSNPLAVAIQADGKIVAVGVPGTTRGRFALVRCNTDGTLDTTFGGDGKVTTDFSDTDWDQAEAVAIQADGKIVAVGWIGFGPMKFALARYNSHGTLDSTFGGDGMVTSHFAAGSQDAASAAAIQADGRIVAAGFSNGKFGLAPYLAA